MIMHTQIEKLKQLESFLKSRIKGQDNTIEEMVEMFFNGEIDLVNKEQPKASFLFLGPTGVGKTEVTKVVSEFMFGKDKMFRFDIVNTRISSIGNIKYISIAVSSSSSSLQAA